MTDFAGLNPITFRGAEGTEGIPMEGAVIWMGGAGR